MSNKITKTLYLIISISALMLSACGANLTNAATQTQAVNAIYTAAAQTIEASMPKETATPIPTETPLPSETPTITPTITATLIPPTSPLQNYCDNALFIADVNYPDNTVVSPGQAIEKTWTLQNTGVCPWKESFSFVFSSGNINYASVQTLNQTVDPQQQANVSIKLIAPSKPGTYTGVWRLANAKGDPFGQVMSILIIVGTPGTTTVTPTGAAATITATAAPVTSSETPTIAPTATP